MCLLIFLLFLLMPRCFAMPEILDPIIEVDATGACHVINATIAGKPVVQARHRFRRVPPYLAYNPQAGQLQALHEAVKAGLRAVGVEGPVTFGIDDVLVDVEFYVSDFNKDIDNMAKFLLDALQGPLYTNDRQVMGIRMTKSRVAHGNTCTKICVAKAPLF